MFYEEKSHSVVAYIGRFQPFHLGHKAVIDRALELADRVVVILGSSGGARSPKNPWTADERIEMISSCYDEGALKRITFVAQEDHLYNFDRWLSEVQDKVQNINRANLYNGKHRNGPYSIGLIGVEKDESSFYLKHFPQWQYIEYAPDRLINATDIRKLFFEVQMPPADENAAVAEAAQFLSPPIVEWLERWKNLNSVTFTYICDEWAFLKQHAEMWKDSPYPPTFNTSDALVACSGHVLLITRRAQPGKGQLAIPGGYVNKRETREQTALRELKEETQIKIPMAVLRGSIEKVKDYEDPDRSPRGRIFTKAFLIRLPNEELPKVYGGDDALHARWVPYAEIKRDQMFEDHYDIIEDLMGF